MIAQMEIYVNKRMEGMRMDRCTQIYLWFEVTNARMQKNLRKLKAKKIELDLDLTIINLVQEIKLQ